MSTEQHTNTAPGDTLSAREAAAALGVAFHTLASYRQRGTGPAFTRVGYRTITYSRADIDEWLAARRVVPKRRDKSSD